MLRPGDPLPPLWHFIAHHPSAPMGMVDRDGHPTRGGFLPPIALPRRMWAGGSVEFRSSLHVGDRVEKRSTIDHIEAKEGRSGLLYFVTVLHELSVGDTVCVFERQDLVYRDDPATDAPTPQPKPAPETSDVRETVTPSSVLLFRYSALTFNSHRIHYDRDYAKTVEGYPALVVHGPLTATLLADLAVRTAGERLTSFSFRGMAPLFDDASFAIAGTRSDDAMSLWAETPSGGLAMTATASFS